ncbi:MAG: arsenate reductase (glutaredoxin) [Bacteroidia bacterium]|nr:arsenate reductase (glutaredoxin) [Bacteroidia bacterium]
MYVIYHNKRCGKSRAALAALEDSGKECKVVEYLHQTPSKKELKHILSLLNMKPFDLIRKKESAFVEQFQGKNLSDNEWIDVLLAHPILIERPIVVGENFASIVRSEEKIAELLGR